MIRRLVWAGLGAAVGISAYRRVSRRLAALTRTGRGRRPAGTGVPLAGAAAFLADVRNGRAEYLARYPADPAAGLGGLSGGRSGSGSAARSGSDYAKDGQ
jgi:hypothetical protein